MTKHYNKTPNRYADTPTPISDGYTKPDNIEYVCSYCQCRSIKMDDSEWYCNRCSISQYPDVEAVRSKNRITTPIGLNLEPCLSYLPDPKFKDNNPEIEGTFKALANKGIKITRYEERDGSGRPIKKSGWS